MSNPYVKAFNSFKNSSAWRTIAVNAYDEINAPSEIVFLENGTWEIKDVDDIRFEEELLIVLPLKDQWLPDDDDDGVSEYQDLLSQYSGLFWAWMRSELDQAYEEKRQREREKRDPRRPGRPPKS